MHAAGTIKTGGDSDLCQLHSWKISLETGELPHSDPSFSGMSVLGAAGHGTGSFHPPWKKRHGTLGKCQMD